MDDAGVIVVDDDPRALQAAIGSLRAAGMTTVGCESFVEFRERYIRGRVSCVVTELHMHDGGGMRILAEFVQAGDLVPVVATAASPCVASVVAAMKAGAADVLAKPVANGALAEAVSEAVSRAKLYGRFEEASLAGRRLTQLTAREREVLDRVVAGMSTKQIAIEMGRVQKTVEYHRKSLMRKLDAANVADLVRLVAMAALIDRRTPQREDASKDGAAS